MSWCYHCFLLVFLLVGLFCVHAIDDDNDDDYDFPARWIPVPQHPTDDTFTTTNVTIVTRYGRHRTVYGAVSIDPWSVLVPPSNNNDNNKHKSNRNRIKTSQQAKNYNCIVATNGGPFHADGTSVGTVISHGNTVVDDDTTESHSESFGFGMAISAAVPPPNQSTTASSTAFWVIGSVKEIKAKIARQSSSLYLIENFVTGFDWLVYNGQNIANLRNNTTGADQAARTAVGIDKSGRMVLIVLDGCEKCLRNKGWTLSETADVMINDFGVQFGMNMDGGGSSVFVVQNGKVKSKPTCLDVPIICERPVTTVMCLTHESSWNPTRIKLRP